MLPSRRPKWAYRKGHAPLAALRHLLVFLHRFCDLSSLLRRLRLISRLILGCLGRGGHFLFGAVERVLQFQMTGDKAHNCVRQLRVELGGGSGEAHRGGEGSVFAVRQLLWQDIDADLIFFKRSDRQEDRPLVPAVLVTCKVNLSNRIKFACGNRFGNADQSSPGSSKWIAIGIRLCNEETAARIRLQILRMHGHIAYQKERPARRVEREGHKRSKGKSRMLAGERRQGADRS